RSSSHLDRKYWQPESLLHLGSVIPVRFVYVVGIVRLGSAKVAAHVIAIDLSEVATALLVLVLVIVLLLRLGLPVIRIRLLLLGLPCAQKRGVQRRFAPRGLNRLHAALSTHFVDGHHVIGRAHV